MSNTAPTAKELAEATDEQLRVLHLYGKWAASRAARREIARRKRSNAAANRR